jgi:hypothetical protein
MVFLFSAVIDNVIVRPLFCFAMASKGTNLILDYNKIRILNRTAFKFSIYAPLNTEEPKEFDEEKKGK